MLQVTKRQVNKPGKIKTQYSITGLTEEDFITLKQGLELLKGNETANKLLETFNLKAEFKELEKELEAIR